MDIVVNVDVFDYYGVLFIIKNIFSYIQIFIYSHMKIFQYLYIQKYLSIFLCLKEMYYICIVFQTK